MRRLRLASVAVFLVACSSSTTTIIAAPSTPAPSSSDPYINASPSTHAIDLACSTLQVHLQILSRDLKGQSPDQQPIVEEMALAANQIAKAVPGLENTQAGTDLENIKSDAQYVGEYTGTNLGELLNRLSKVAFGFASLLGSTNEVQCVTCSRKYSSRHPAVTPEPPQRTAQPPPRPDA